MNPKEREEYERGLADLQREAEAAAARLDEQQERERAAWRFADLAGAMVRDLKKTVLTAPLGEIAALAAGLQLAQTEVALYETRAKHENVRSDEARAAVAKMRDALASYNQRWGMYAAEKQREQDALTGASFGRH